MPDNLKKLEEAIHIQFKDRTLIENVFVHRSYLNEHKRFHLPSNEKLEFLGDSVLSLITSVYLFKNYPDFQEGDYTEIKSSIVKTESLAVAARILRLGDYIYLSKGEEQGMGRVNTNILADCFEALIGCIFIDQSFEAAYDFVIGYLFKSNNLDGIIETKTYLSAKGKLQEYIQRKFKVLPSYRVLDQKGPEHDRVFRIGVFLKSKKMGEGIASSKKLAEEKAAQVAFENRKSL